MKKIAVVVAVVLLVVSLGSFAFAEEMKGAIKSVDAAAGTVVLSSGGKDVTLKADKAVDLNTLKAGQKVEATVENDVLKSVKIAKPKAAVGC
jgi:cold shock CspA family protein